jgi:UDP-N-acetylglucosamine 2-epimerase (non-hydrolysing)
VEAGLRSFDRAMPEEHNRTLTDRVSDLLLAPTSCSRDNLLRERIDARIVVTGNTVVEAVRSMLPGSAERSQLLADRGLEPDGYLLVTLHRPENTDDRDRLGTILAGLAELDLPVVFPVHPRTTRRIQEFGLGTHMRQLRVLEPLGYREFLALSAESALLVSDSGGVQEEASVYKRPVVVVRRSTERPEVLGDFSSLCLPDTLVDHVAAWMEDLPSHHARMATVPSPYGEGEAARLSADAIIEHLG